jgi:hypothetical protein
MKKSVPKRSRAKAQQSDKAITHARSLIITRKQAATTTHKQVSLTIIILKKPFLDDDAMIDDDVLFYLLRHRLSVFCLANLCRYYKQKSLLVTT